MDIVNILNGLIKGLGKNAEVRLPIAMGIIALAFYQITGTLLSSAVPIVLYFMFIVRKGLESRAKAQAAEQSIRRLELTKGKEIEDQLRREEAKRERKKDSVIEKRENNG